MAEAVRKKIGFYTAGPAFDGGTLKERALGGSETALIQAARALAAIGHEVLVFNNCPRPGVFDGVAYIPAAGFPRYAAGGRFDAFIVSRYYGFFQVPFDADVKVLWNHDVLDRPAQLRSLADGIDLFLVLSRFHRDNFLTRLPEIAGRTVVTRNGLDFATIDRAAAGAVKDNEKIIYASRPERGLEVLLERIWPELRRTRPGLTLHLCGYQLAREDIPPESVELYRRLDRLVAETPGVEVLGPLPKAEYYRHLASSSLMLYPCWFPETSCLAVLEAQACGTGVVTTDDFALSESVKVRDFLVPGRPDRDDYQQKFIERTIELLDDPGRTRALAVEAGDRVRTEHGWDRIVSEWDRLFDLASRSKNARQASIRESGGWSK